MPDFLRTALTDFTSSSSIPSSLSAWKTNLLRRIGFLLLNLLGLVLLLLFATYCTWFDLNVLDRPRAWPMMALLVAGYLSGWALSQPLKTHPRGSGPILTALSVFVTFILVIGILFMVRAYYSRTFVVVFISSTLPWSLAVASLSRPPGPSLALVPGELTNELKSIENLTTRDVLASPTLNHPVDGVVADFNEELSDRWARFISRCQARGIPVYDASAVYEYFTGQVRLENLSEHVVQGFTRPWLYLRLRRLLELTAIMVALPFLLLHMIGVALAIWVESGRPVLFTQPRTGQGGEPFEMLKFRTMEPGADRDEPSFASESDQRVTSLGALLRHYRLDELPQFWNVLKGEMSIIGPRPEQVPFAREYTKEMPFYSYRHMVRPGITGWAQVSHGYGANRDQNQEKLKYDLYYVKHLGPWLDLVIVYRTIKVILNGFGAR